MLADLPTDPHVLTRMPWGRLTADSPVQGVGLGSATDGRDLFGDAVTA